MMYYPTDEICDSLDNDCDGIVDEITDESGNQGDPGSICACQKSCQFEDECLDANNLSSCMSIDGMFSMCLTECVTNDECSNLNPTSPVCTLVWELGGIGICSCEPECPQTCTIDMDCLPYGLSHCMQGFCTKTCEMAQPASPSECPKPYSCVSGMCVCDPAQSCLSCEYNDACWGGAYPCEVRAGFMECQIPCDINEHCLDVAMFSGLELYCNYDMDMGLRRCVCEPEMKCQDCSFDPEMCNKQGMYCTDFVDASKMVCSGDCQSDAQCPTNWYCLSGFCVESTCHCDDIECDPSADASDTYCQEAGLEYEFTFCQAGSNDAQEIGFCSKPCYSHMECPIGFFCNYPEMALHGVCQCQKYDSVNIPIGK
jgi:hypothetical protein